MANKILRLVQCSSIALSVMFLVAILQGCGTGSSTETGTTIQPSQADIVTVYPAAAGEPLSAHYTVTAGGQNSPTYVAPAQAVETISPQLFLTGEAAFTSFDLQGSTTVSITRLIGNPVQSAKVLPTSRGITPTISGNTITFTVSQPGPLTVDVNGDWMNDVHVFVNPPETNIPSPTDPNVIYYGPGVHMVTPTQITSNKTVYIAGGAILYGQLDPAQKTPFYPIDAVFYLTGSNITLRGRGIIDGSLIPAGKSDLVTTFEGKNVNVEGVTLRNSYSWHSPVEQSNGVTISNIKILGSQINADGIDIVNSQDVTVTNSFIRAFDDLVLVKTKLPSGQVSKNITVSNMVLWNGLAHAMSLGAEFKEDMSNVTFTNSDIIHDKGREWLLRVFDTDSGTGSNVTFSDIRIEECRQLLSLWIGEDTWSTDATRGNIRNVNFSNIQAPIPERPALSLNFVGYDATHDIEGVILNGVVVGGAPITASSIVQNQFVSGVTITP